MSALLFLLLLAGPSQDGADTFQKGLERVRQLEDEERWSRAREELVLLFEEHRERDYVRRKLPELRDQITRIEFGLTYEEPAARELISGQVVKYDPATGQIQIRYRPVKGRERELGDFEEQAGFYLHPLFFVGRHSITLKGVNFDREARLIASASADRSLQAIIEPFGGTAALVFDEGELYRRVLDQNKQKLLRQKEPYEIKLVVREGEVVVTCNKKPLLRAKGEAQPGRIGFMGIRPREILIEGKATTAWIEDLLGQAAERERARFEREFDPETELPDWLLSMNEAAVVEPLPPYPNAENPAHPRIWNEIAELIEEEKYGLARQKLLELDDGQTTEAFREFALAYIDVQDAFGEEALFRLERVRELEPGFAGARVLEATVRLDQGRTQEALEILEQVTLDAPLQANGWLWLIRVELLAGKLDKAQATLDRARHAGIPPATLGRLSKRLGHARNGPGWARAFLTESEHYRVASNLSRSICVEAARILEEMLQLYRENFPGLAPAGGKEPYPVYLFAGQAGYLSYLGDLGRDKPERSAGLYSPDLKQLVIWNLRDRDALQLTIRHAGVHQVLDAALPDAPAWLDEGLAEYYAPSGIASISLLMEQTADWVPFESFLRMSDREFQRAPDLHYAQARGLVQFLMHAAPEERERLDAYLAALADGRSWSVAAESLLDGRDAQELHRQVLAYLIALRREER